MTVQNTLEHHRNSHVLVSAAWMVADGLMFAVMNLVVRMNVEHIDPRVALCFRYALSIPIAMAAVALTEARPRRGISLPPGPRGAMKARVALCACTALVSNVAWYQAMGMLPLSVSTTLFYTKSLFLVLLTALLFGERIRMHHVLACTTGIAGVMLVTGVDGTAFSAGVLLVLLSAMASALMILQIKSIGVRMTPLRLTLALSITGAPLSFLIALPVWAWPTSGLLACFALVALLSVGIHVAIANAYRRSPVASLAPFDFLRLVFVLALEFLVIGLNVPPEAWIGSTMILAAVVFNAVQASRQSVAAARDANRTAAS